MSAPNQNQNVNENTPGLIASHAQYVKGAAEVRLTFHPSPFPLKPLTAHSVQYEKEILKRHHQETIGNVTGSDAWKNSGVQDKEHAIGDMKAASAKRDATSQGLGGVEEKAGSLVGCEGMVKEGAESKRA